MRIAISLDSACDLTSEIIKEYDFKTVPFCFKFVFCSKLMDLFPSAFSLQEVFYSLHK